MAPSSAPTSSAPPRRRPLRSGSPLRHRSQPARCSRAPRRFAAGCRTGSRRSNRPAAAAPDAKKPADFQTAMRQAIAAAMARSNREIPHYYLETRIDMSQRPALAGGGKYQAHRSRTACCRCVVLLKAVATAPGRCARAERLLDRRPPPDQRGRSTSASPSPCARAGW